MKTKVQRWITILITFIMMLSMQMVVASAKEDNGVSINISTDKRVYQKGDEVNATVSIQNKNNFDIKNISLVSTLPAGITTVNNSNLNLEGKSLKAGEKTSISFKAKIASVTEVKNEQSTSTVTEDHNATKDNQTDNTKTGATTDSKIDTTTDATKTEENTTISPSTYDNKQGILIF